MLAKTDTPDADGFVTVMSKRPRVFERPADAPAATTAPLKLHPNFYRTGSRPSGAHRGNGKQRCALRPGSHASVEPKEVEELRRRFEEDKRRILQLKEANIFHPL